MKLKITYFALSFLLSMPSLTHTFTLSSVKPLDGLFIDGEVIRDIRKYQFDIKKLLSGKLQTNRTRAGAYEYEGNKYSVQELAMLEQEVGNNQQLQILLTQMRDDFVQISKPFEQAIRNARPILKRLVKESILKRLEESSKEREKKDSLLNKWSECSTANERELFERHLQTVQEFNIFLIDLYYFLTDIFESCPKARKQYDEWRKKVAASKNAR